MWLKLPKCFCNIEPMCSAMMWCHLFRNKNDVIMHCRHTQLDVATLATVVFTDIGLRCQVECKQHSGTCAIWMCLGVCTHCVWVWFSFSNEFLVPCQDGDIRLRGGRNSTEGRVEICFNNQWGTVCDNFWDVKDATVVCTQLGLPSEGKLVSRS